MCAPVASVANNSGDVICCLDVACHSCVFLWRHQTTRYLQHQVSAKTGVQVYK